VGDNQNLSLPASTMSSMSESTLRFMIVVTETSRYVLDRLVMSATRIPGAGAGAVVGLPAPILAHLRRDAEALHLIEWPEPRVGEEMRLLLMVREDGVPTVRTTTIVRAVHRY
jgi:hypothetical protein